MPWILTLQPLQGRHRSLPFQQLETVSINEIGGCPTRGCSQVSGSELGAHEFVPHPCRLAFVFERQGGNTTPVETQKQGPGVPTHPALRERSESNKPSSPPIAIPRQNGAPSVSPAFWRNGWENASEVRPRAEADNFPVRPLIAQKDKVRDNEPTHCRGIAWEKIESVRASRQKT